MCRGGPLLDHQGRVVGIVAARINQSQDLGLAIPVNYAYEVEPALVRPPFRPRPDRKALMGRVAKEDRREMAKVSEEGEVADVTWTRSWRAVRFGVSGVKVHDARLVALIPGYAEAVRRLRKARSTQAGIGAAGEPKTVAGRPVSFPPIHRSQLMLFQQPQGVTVKLERFRGFLLHRISLNPRRLGVFPQTV